MLKPKKKKKNVVLRHTRVQQYNCARADRAVTLSLSLVCRSVESALSKHLSSSTPLTSQPRRKRQSPRLHRCSQSRQEASQTSPGITPYYQRGASHNPYPRYNTQEKPTPAYIDTLHEQPPSYRRATQLQLVQQFCPGHGQQQCHHQQQRSRQQHCFTHHHHARHCSGHSRLPEHASFLQ